MLDFAVSGALRLVLKPDDAENGVDTDHALSPARLAAAIDLGLRECGIHRLSYYDGVYITNMDDPDDSVMVRVVDVLNPARPDHRKHMMNGTGKRTPTDMMEATIARHIFVSLVEEAAEKSPDWLLGDLIVIPLITRPISSRTVQELNDEGPDVAWIKVMVHLDDEPSCPGCRQIERLMLRADSEVHDLSDTIRRVPKDSMATIMLTDSHRTMAALAEDRLRQIEAVADVTSWLLSN